MSLKDKINLEVQRQVKWEKHQNMIKELKEMIDIVDSFNTKIEKFNEQYGTDVKIEGMEEIVKGLAGYIKDVEAEDKRHADQFAEAIKSIGLEG